MAYIDVPVIAGEDDAVSFHNHSGFTTNYNGNAGWIHIQQHVNDTLATVTGWRFRIPDTIDPSTITNVQLRVALNGSSADISSMLPVNLIVEPKPASAFANTTGERPSNRYFTLDTAGAAKTPWQMTTTVSGQFMTSAPDLSTHIKDAMEDEDYVPGTSYVGILAKAPIGGPFGLQSFCYEVSNSSLRPNIRITYDAPVNYDPITAMNVSYNDGIGSGTNRNCDIYVPGGQPSDEAGRPTVIYLHGGFWRTGVGSRSMMNTTWKDSLVDDGFVVVNASYSLVQSDILFGNTGRSFPEPIQDMRTLSKFLTDNSEEYRIDPSRMVICGESAGGHIALWSAISQGDTVNYTGYQNLDANRSTTPGNTRPIFDLDKNISSTPFAAAFAWVAPVDAYEITQHPNGTQAGVNHIGRTGYMGEKQFNNPGSQYDELDLHKYISGTGNTYGTTKHEPQIPIGYMRATNDTIVLPSAGINPLYSALGESEFTYERPPVGVVSENGLSRFEINAAHDTSLQDTSGHDVFIEWLNVVLGIQEQEEMPWTPGITLF